MSIWTPNSFEDAVRRDAMEEGIINLGGTLVSLAFYGLVIFMALGVVSSIGRAALGITYEDVMARHASVTSISSEKVESGK